MTTSSRMTYAFARDGGLPASRFFARVHPRLDLPLNALYLTTALVVVFGCIFLGSSSAFNAIISASVVALGVSYGIPIAINCIRGRKMLGPRPFVLPGVVGWAANIVCAVFTPSFPYFWEICREKERYILRDEANSDCRSDWHTSSSQQSSSSSPPNFMLRGVT